MLYGFIWWHAEERCSDGSRVHVLVHFVAATGGSFVTFGCQVSRCSEFGLKFDAFLSKAVELPLLPDDTEVNGHRVCTVVMEGATQCKFNFTSGNKMKLVVQDDECKRRGHLLVCSIWRAGIVAVCH